MSTLNPAAQDTPHLETRTNYLERPLPLGLIAAAFLVPATYTILSQAAIITSFEVVKQILVSFLSTSHFLVTGALYFRPEHRQYFSSSTKNKIVYFVVPICILFFYFGIGVFGIMPGDALPSLDERPDLYPFLWLIFGVGAITTGFSLVHVLRQTFGLLQMLKRVSGGTFSPWTRSVENVFGFSSAFILFDCMLFNNRVAWPGNSRTVLEAVLLVVLAMSAITALLGILIGIRKDPDRVRAMYPAVYHLMWMVMVGAALYDSDFAFIAGAVHQVEYHVMMTPRCLRAPSPILGRAKGVLGWFRERRSRFFVILAVVTAVVIAPETVVRFGFRADNHMKWALLNCLNGVNMVHFFVDSFIWKFRNQFYGAELRNLYFSPPIAVFEARALFTSSREPQGDAGAARNSAPRP